ncbi:hypothetical protein FACUT_13665 [Fusarium acutatum]|uniref:Myb-like domain-containing protein n=1 Tax=Fusarium acutatum TaxID=78861 RepID=A0A8H4NHR6_9HYPO|nr:hypothetical protein FACUT_13665 [Fusarium acutatum]
MSLVFKSYDPVRDQQRAERRRRKRSAERSTLVPSSATYIDIAPSQSLVAGHKRSRVDENFIPFTNMDATEDPYCGFPSVEECLEFCSPRDTNMPSAYTPTSANLLSYPDSGIDIQDVSSDSSCQKEAYKDDRLGRKLPRAIGTIPSASDLDIEREAYDVNASGIPASTTVSEESDRGISPAEHALLSDAETTPSTALSISTLASVTSPIYQKRTSTWRNQNSFVDNKDGAQDSSTGMADLGVPDTMSEGTLFGEGLLVVESQDNIAPESSSSSNRPLSQDIQALRNLVTMEESVTEPSSAEKTPTQDAAPSSTKRSFSESGATSDSQPSSSEVWQSPKRLRFTSISSEEAVSTFLDIQKIISNVLAKRNQDQPHSLIPDVSVQSMSDTIQVAMDGVGDDSSDDSANTSSSFDDSESETELTTLQTQGFHHRSTQRRRWTSMEENLLRALKSTQKRSKGKPSDCQIASKLSRTESGVKQHWDIMLQREQKDRDRLIRG